MAEALKAEGNKLFQAGDYEGAVKKYTEAIAIDPEVFSNILYFFFLKFFCLVKQVFQNHLLFSNRSAAYLKMNMPLEAHLNAVKAGVKKIHVSLFFLTSF